MSSSSRQSNEIRPLSPAEARCALRMAELLRRGVDVRQAKVNRLRHRVRDGDYENDLKLDIAAERVLHAMLDEPPSYLATRASAKRCPPSR